MGLCRDAHLAEGRAVAPEKTKDRSDEPSDSSWQDPSTLAVVFLGWGAFVEDHRTAARCHCPVAALAAWETGAKQRPASRFLPFVGPKGRLWGGKTVGIAKILVQRVCTQW